MMTPDELRALADALADHFAVSRESRKRAADYLRACAEAEPVAVPAGYKLVPVEPTPEMLSAVGMMDGYDWHAPGCSPDADHANWYSAMIAAAPAAPQAEPKREPLSDLIERAEAARRFPTNTCGASRHAEQIGVALVLGEPYPMLTEEPNYCGESILATVAALWEARTEIERLTAALRAQPGPVSMDDMEWAGKVHLAEAIRERDEHARWRADLADKLHDRETTISAAWEALRSAGVHSEATIDDGIRLLRRQLAEAELKREPLSDERIDVALQTDPAMILALMSGEMTVGEFKAALRRVARTVERAHGIGGSDE